MSAIEPVHMTTATGKGWRPMVRLAAVLLLIAAVALGACYWFWRLSSTERKLVGTWTCTDETGTRHQLQMRSDRTYAIVFREPTDVNLKPGSSGSWRVDGRKVVFTMPGDEGPHFLAELLDRLLNEPDHTVMDIGDLTHDRLVTRFVETGVEWEWSRQGDESHGSSIVPESPFPKE